MMAYPQEPTTVGVIGLGTIGMSWAAYFLARGLTVRATDVDAAAEARTLAYVDKAWPALQALSLVEPGASTTSISFHRTVEEAVSCCEFVQENAPEIDSLKAELLARIDHAAAPDVPIASSTSALGMTAMQRDCRFPERCFVGHPFNPPHLIPLVELVGGSRTAAAVLDWAETFYRGLKRQPVRLNREIYGHIANRLQYVIFNEAARLVLEGVASVEDVDAAVSWGPGMRWAFFGPFMTMHLGGGRGGMAGAFEKFKDRDSKSTDRAARMQLSPDQQRILLAGLEAAVAGRSVEELEASRDARILELYRLKTAG